MSIVDEEDLKPLHLRKDRACVVPVAADDALAWAAGKLQDVDLLTKAPLVPEAVFIVNLPSLATYREVLTQVKFWRAAGAVFLITRTGTACVDRHLGEKNGCIRAFKENTDPVKYRFIAPPDVFRRWVDKWSGPTGKRLLQRQPGAKPR
jgi:hypothetical protein